MPSAERPYHQKYHQFSKNRAAQRATVGSKKRLRKLDFVGRLAR
jgi:hypothetical protein